jgi:hypothetical protein
MGGQSQNITPHWLNKSKSFNRRKTIMNNIHNFANRQLCEYASIFPTVASLLGHLLFTNGNGYSVCDGMIVDGSNVRIDEYPKMTDAAWDVLIAKCYAKERQFAEQFARGKPINETELAEDCAIYQRHSVTDSDFSVPALLADLFVKMEQRQEQFPSREYYLRPYPLSKGYADVFRLNEKTPTWFLQIAYNFCIVWEMFLTKEIETGHVWLPPSQRPKVELTEAQKNVAKGMKDLFASIKSDSSYDGWLDKPEPESDYADMEWTTEHRDLIAGEVIRLGALLEK